LSPWLFDRKRSISLPPDLAKSRGGSRQANLARLLAFCEIEELSYRQSLDVGVLEGQAGHDVVDVAVVEGAIRRHDAVITSNPTLIASIADATRTGLRVEAI
jgi:hypothetical protein